MPALRNNAAGPGHKYMQTSASTIKVQSQYCNEAYTSRGIKLHEKSCLRRKEKRKEDREFAWAAVHSILNEGEHNHRNKKYHPTGASAQAPVLVDSSGGAAAMESVPTTVLDSDMYDHDVSGHDYPAVGLEGGLDDTQSIEAEARQCSNSDTSMASASAGAAPPPGLIPVSAATAMTSARSDTFKTEFHPHSGRPETVETFSAYGGGSATRSPIVDDTPWHPFTCRADFKFAELAHKAALNKDQTNELLKFIWRVADGHMKFSFKTHADVMTAWARSSTQLTPFEKHIIPVEYKKEVIEYEFYSRPLWDCAMDLLANPLLAPHFVWDAQRLYKHDGTRFECFFHEPWTGDRWWNLQSSLPENGAPFAFILYADKTHLSSAGTVKAYPVIACCGNLPVDIRNVDGTGGGHMVGWLPIVPEDSDEDGKLSYTNLKCVIWHESFSILLVTIILLSATAFAHECYDRTQCWLFPLILILSADYEEQCVMALIWGLKSGCPCPICLVLREALTDHSTTYPKRTIEDAQNRVALWSRDHVAGEAELKKQSLRPIKNAFWKVRLSDPHDALSQDPLHVYHKGKFGDHLFDECKKHLKALGRVAKKTVDEQFDVFLRWRILNHFDCVTNIYFTDGNKFQDTSKQIVYAAQNVLTRVEDEAGYALLKCIVSYLHIDMYVSLDVHTESTLAAGEAEILVFQELLDEYIEALGDDATKNWNFPKAHASKHVFTDIREKGAARNFSTRPNEKQHGPIKCAYKLQTNGKDIANQILRLDHMTFVSGLIRSRIDYLDEERRKVMLSERELEEEDLDDQPFGGHIYLGAPQHSLTLLQLDEENTSNPAFAQFHKKLSLFLNNFLPAHNIPLPDGKTWLRLSAQDTVQEHRFLKVNYESVVDWKLATDYLRCNPSFHGHERRDCALIHTNDKDGNDKNIFVRILLMFKHTVGSKVLDLALVQTMDAQMGPQCIIDQHL
ncbi:hypothetical protein F4604DRAFT_1920145 [Suillus subluteus]|nr:hypothetical protein F4604DRAFT_1920145 [Suillus subluteus]